MATRERWVELLTEHRDRYMLYPITEMALQPFVFGVIESAAQANDLDDIKAVLAAYHELTEQS